MEPLNPDRVSPNFWPWVILVVVLAGLALWIYFDIRASLRRVACQWNYPTDAQSAYTAVIARLSACKGVTPMASGPTVVVEASRTSSLLILPALMFFPLGLLLLLLKSKGTAVVQIVPTGQGVTQVVLSGRTLPRVVAALGAGATRSTAALGGFPSSPPVGPARPLDDGNTWGLRPGS